MAGCVLGKREGDGNADAAVMCVRHERARGYNGVAMGIDERFLLVPVVEGCRQCVGSVGGEAREGHGVDQVERAGIRACCAMRCRCRIGQLGGDGGNRNGLPPVVCIGMACQLGSFGVVQALEAHERASCELRRVNREFQFRASVCQARRERAGACGQEVSRLPVVDQVQLADKRIRLGGAEVVVSHRVDEQCITRGRNHLVSLCIGERGADEGLDCCRIVERAEVDGRAVAINRHLDAQQVEAGVRLDGQLLNRVGIERQGSLVVVGGRRRICAAAEPNARFSVELADVNGAVVEQCGVVVVRMRGVRVRGRCRRRLAVTVGHYDMPFARRD